VSTGSGQRSGDEHHRLQASAAHRHHRRVRPAPLAAALGLALGAGLVDGFPVLRGAAVAAATALVALAVSGWRIRPAVALCLVVGGVGALGVAQGVADLAADEASTIATLLAVALTVLGAAAAVMGGRGLAPVPRGLVPVGDLDQVQHWFTLRTVVEAAGDAVLTVDERGRVLAFNRAAEDLTGWTAEELIGQDGLRLLHPADHPALRRQALAAIAEGRDAVDNLSARCVRRDGTVCPVEVSIARADLGAGRMFMVIARDASERSRVEAELTRRALHDPLTGLPNRTLLHDRLSSALGRAERSGRWPTVLFIDLDHFKGVNDRLGHDGGDRLLVQVAHRLLAELRPSDTAARLGGDEFVVLGDALDAEAARTLAGRLLEAIGRPLDVDGAAISITASIGVVEAGPGTTADDLLRDADASMYRAKGAGRNRLQVFDDDLRADGARRLELATDLRRALSADELELWYQPQFAVDGLAVVGVEALVRWRHPDLGLLEPDTFLDVATETGIDVALDRWVLHRATRDAASWPTDASPSELVVWVNLSARSLTDGVLAETVLDTLAATGLPPTRLGVEVTERALARDIDVASQGLDRLRRAGVRVAIDDFGTGFSSLSWLERLPLDVLKIDRSFTGGLGAADDDTAIVRSVIAVAHGLGLSALAEGVETPEQVGLLRGLGCDRLQGFLLSPPITADDIARTRVRPSEPLAGLTG
jgi:diguanylate cyclase (GGDEF)-like protein/PAS domain S-box-containing protein